MNSDAADRYAAACARRELLVGLWEELGRPMLGEGGATGRATVPHPLIAMLREADALCDRLASSLKAAQHGRLVGSASAADRTGEPPRVKLRAVDAAKG